MMRSQRPGVRRFRPQLDALEDRCVPAAAPLDPTFGSGGMETLPVSPTTDEANAVAVQPDGKIVVAGSAEVTDAAGTHAEFAVVRLNADGSLDTGFGSGGT